MRTALMNATARCEQLEPRRLLSADPVPRPAWNTGTGFFVSGNKVYDANGYEFIIKGPNQNQWWGNPTENLNAIDHVAKTGANAVRAVFNWADASGGSNTPAERKTIVERYLANNMVPIVEDHATTNTTDHESPTALAAVVDHWLDPANVQWLQQYESKLMLNIANEWGPTTSVWRDSYITQVQRLRNAGVNALIVLDAGGWGQDINTIKNYAAAVQAADPQHNILFSIHFYSQWRTEDRSFEVNSSTWDIATQLSAVQNLGLPILAGEFSWEGMDSAPYRTRRVLEICNSLGVGFMGWAWNNNSPATLNMLPGSTYQYNSNLDITTWGDIFINDPTYGTKASAQRATVFPAAAPRFILEKTNVTVPETGQALARVRLNSAPLTNVTVNLTKTAGGDANVNLAGATSLVFTPGNWNQYQSILLSASSDADVIAGTARFQLTASGLTTTDIIAKELDANIAPGNFTLNPTDDRDTQSTGDATGVATTGSASLFNTFLMKFSLASVGGKASSATLRVYKNQTTSNMIGRAWIMLSDSWTQATAQASLPVKSYPLQSLTMPNGVGYMNFDVSSAINQELFGDRVITLAITTNSNNWTAFQTREGANQPQLLVNSAEAVAPQLVSSVFDHSTNPNKFTFTFNENVFASMSSADMQLQSLTDPSTVLTLSSPIDLGANTVSYSITPGIVP
ncbi:MAG: cellulase family glycosylhydrolase, partial [Anaerolineae bacterium]|nr:cellulase family glycosylhydrolase [Phycisphaerae bacterium]